MSYLLQGGRQLDAADGGILKGAGIDYGDGIPDAGNLDMLGDDDILAREVGCGGTPHADASGLVVDDIEYAVEVYLSRMARGAGDNRALATRRGAHRLLVGFGVPLGELELVGISESAVLGEVLLQLGVVVKHCLRQREERLERRAYHRLVLVGADYSDEITVANVDAPFVAVGHAILLASFLDVFIQLVERSDAAEDHTGDIRQVMTGGRETHIGIVAGGRQHVVHIDERLVGKVLGCGHLAAPCHLVCRLDGRIDGFEGLGAQRRVGFITQRGKERRVLLGDAHGRRCILGIAVVVGAQHGIGLLLESTVARALPARRLATGTYGRRLHFAPSDCAHGLIGSAIDRTLYGAADLALDSAFYFLLEALAQLLQEALGVGVVMPGKQEEGTTQDEYLISHTIGCY